MKWFPGFVIGLGLMLSSCLQAPTPLTGTWRSRAAELTLTGQGGSIQFGCATGIISQGVLVNALGEFSVNGSYTQGSGAAPPPNFPPPVPQPTVYSGKVSGNTLIFSGRILGETNIGPITLVRDGPDQVIVCA